MVGLASYVALLASPINIPGFVSSFICALVGKPRGSGSILVTTPVACVFTITCGSVAVANLVIVK